MPRISRPATHTGDDGSTSTVTGQRVSKDAAEICAYGVLDELNSAIGVALSLEGLSSDLRLPLQTIQNDLFHLGAEFNSGTSEQTEATQPRIEERHVEKLDDILANLYEELDPLTNFTLPGGSPSAASLHLARAVCRRAERVVVTLSSTEEVGVLALKYLNRLSDAMFLMARLENKRSGKEELVWDSYD
jgi:cob(I)alamin adenosyltransferase